MSKVVCLGYFGRGNSGDEAFMASHQWFFGKDNVQFANGKLTSEFVAGRPVFLGGGDVVAPFFLDWIPNSVEFSMLGVGLKYEASSLRAMESKGSALKHSWFRNHIDVDLAHAAGFSAEYCPDIVFALRDVVAPLPPSVQEILKSIGPGNKFAVVCLTDHFNSRSEAKDVKHNAYLEYFKWELAEALDRLAQDMPIVFLPLSVYLQHQDARMHSDVVMRMKRPHRVHQIAEELTPIQAISLVRKSSHMISMKLHGNIFGLLTKRRCVNIGVGRKQLTLYSENGLQDSSVHPGELTVRSFEAAFNASCTDEAQQAVSSMADANYDALCLLRSKLRALTGLTELTAPA